MQNLIKKVKIMEDKKDIKKKVDCQRTNKTIKFIDVDSPLFEYMAIEKFYRWCSENDYNPSSALTLVEYKDFLLKGGLNE